MRKKCQIFTFLRSFAKTKNLAKNLQVNSRFHMMEIETNNLNFPHEISSKIGHKVSTFFFVVSIFKKLVKILLKITFTSAQLYWSNFHNELRQVL